ncbi:MAG: HD-GYP domain-containing protein [Firmicutes bacterium]|nr:HD-GYP domain-containing protein [Bacillota bacterium]
MRFLPIDQIQEGMYLARNVLGNDGRILLVKGTKLTKSYLQKLKELNYRFLYIGETPEDFEFRGPVSDETYTKAICTVRDSMIRAAKYQSLDLPAVIEVADFMLDEVMEEGVVYNIIELKNHSNYTYLHSVNVGVLSVLLGKALKLNRRQLKEMVTGALLHDIGKVYIENPILEKVGRLSAPEYEKVKRHPQYGFDLLRGHPELSLLSAHVAYQHHERADGSGYPRGLTAEQIHYYAKIVMVADSYDAMTSGRHYREAMWSHSALAELQAAAPEKYDPKVVSVLSQVVALYPVGSVVLLNNMEVATVCDVTLKKIKLKLLTGKNKGQKLELSRNSRLKIERRLS